MLDRPSSLEGVIVGFFSELDPGLVPQECRLEVLLVNLPEPLDQAAVVPGVDLLLLAFREVDGVLGVLVLIRVLDQMLMMRILGRF